MFHKIYVIEGNGALVNEKGEEQHLKAGDFALVNPDERHQCANKGDAPFKIICGVPKDFEQESLSTLNFALSTSLRGAEGV
jgi:quercetin dioxygenase-like cupin family protein